MNRRVRGTLLVLVIFVGLVLLVLGACFLKISSSVG